MNGTCGSANGVTYPYGSSSYSPNVQCSNGSPSNTSFPTTGNSVSWTCSGTNGGSASGTCSATVTPAPVNGTCGSANGVTYPYGSSSYSPNVQCSNGSPSNTSFPTTGNSVSWTCSGTNGGSASPTCSASQATPPPPTPTASLTPASQTFDVGSSATLTWSSTNATSCTGVGFSTSGRTSGSFSTGTLNTPGTQNYQVYCSAGGVNSSPAVASSHRSFSRRDYQR